MSFTPIVLPAVVVQPSVIAFWAATNKPAFKVKLPVVVANVILPLSVNVTEAVEPAAPENVGWFVTRPFNTCGPSANVIRPAVATLALPAVTVGAFVTVPLTVTPPVEAKLIWPRDVAALVPLLRTLPVTKTALANVELMRPFALLVMLAMLVTPPFNVIVPAPLFATSLIVVAVKPTMIAPVLVFVTFPTVNATPVPVFNVPEPAFERSPYTVTWLLVAKLAPDERETLPTCVVPMSVSVCAPDPVTFGIFTPPFKDVGPDITNARVPFVTSPPSVLTVPLIVSVKLPRSNAPASVERAPASVLFSFNVSLWGPPVVTVDNVLIAVVFAAGASSSPVVIGPAVNS